VLNLDGVLFSYDSEKILRGLSFAVYNTWVVFLDLKEIYDKSNFWVIGLQDEELYGVELKYIQTEPTVRLPTKVHKLNIPLIKEVSFSKEEEQVAQLNFFIKHDQWRSSIFKELKPTRSAKMPDFYYTDNLKEDNDINIRKKDHDKLVLHTMKEYVVAGNAEKVIDLFDMLMLYKSRELAITMVGGLDEQEVVQLLNNKIKYLKLIEDKNTKQPSYNPFIENYNEYKSKANTNEVKEEERSSLSSLAVNLNNFKDLETEVRNELETIPEEEKYIKVEDLNSIRNNSNFEKKPVK
jgi:hypothetical protein